MDLVVLGDALLDVDVVGNADRLCPDAPVPVVDVSARRLRPGGAALAASLAAEQGLNVSLVTGWAADSSGHELRQLLGGRVRLIGVPLLGNTPSKTRVRASGQSLVRLDSGDGRVPDVPLGAEVAAALQQADGVLVADYGRGLTSNTWLRRELSRLPPSVPLVGDPHPKGADPIPRCDLVVPNRAEAARLVDVSSPVPAAVQLWRKWECGAVAITLGAQGAVVVPGAERVKAPEVPAVSDVCGAGDSFSVTAVSALMLGSAAVDAVRAAVDQASWFVANGGAASWAVTDSPKPLPTTKRPSVFDVVDRTRSWGGRVVAAGGCFDLLHPGHVSLLNRARSLGDALVVCMNSDDSVRRLKGPPRPVVAAEDRRCLLEALECVDAVAVFEENSPCSLLEQIRPDVWVKGGDYEPSQLPEKQVVESYGGRTVLLPLVDGYSTTRLLSSLQITG
jgi:D-beta-D-heptose 7-phosphate kinase/D-beta-D-heptose 1-phosphate adenosyltransferase